MSAVQISRIAPAPILVTFWQMPGKSARMDCTGFSCSTHSTNLPFTPLITPVGDPEQGQFEIQPHTEQQGELLKEGKSYWLRMILRNEAGAGVLDPTFRIEVR